MELTDLFTGILFTGLAAWWWLQGGLRRLGIPDLLVLNAVIFLWLAPAVNYLMVEQGWYTQYAPMPIDRGRYYAVALPMIAGLWLGAWLVQRLFPTDLSPSARALEENASRRPWIGLALAAMGLLCGAILPYISDPFKLLFHFGSLMTGAGGYWLFFSRRPWNWLGPLLIFAWMAAGALSFGSVGEPLGFLLFLILFYWLRKEPSLARRAILVAALGLAVVFPLSFKYEYRAVLYEWQQEGKEYPDKVALLGRILREHFLEPRDADAWRNDASNVLDRFNQGYFLAHAVQHTPSKEPFARGETVWTALKAAVIPRFVWKDKPIAGGAENLLRFAGITYKGSANIGPLGDGYVNFGRWGGALFALLYGAGISFLSSLMARSSLSPFLLPFIPFIFSPLLNVETDLLTNFNHLAKASLFALGMAWVFKAGFKVVGLLGCWVVGLLGKNL